MLPASVSTIPFNANRRYFEEKKPINDLPQDKIHNRLKRFFNYLPTDVDTHKSNNYTFANRSLRSQSFKMQHLMSRVLLLLLFDSKAT